ncbi:MAG TPA: outer membrane beta-barrel protein [Pyrinomonadaceae bacterium]|nr:outer membrane beta-barrel protein [Pyrinomonadaceae bacterium]
MRKLLLVACCLLAACAVNAQTQKNEFSVMAGGGSLSGGGESVAAAPNFTVAYTRGLTDRVAVEGSLDGYYVKQPGIARRDDYIDAQVAGLFHFAPMTATGRVIPYLTAGVGKVSTDPTEIPANVITRLGGGIKYYPSDSYNIGLRVELRDEITRRGGQGYPVPGNDINIISLRAGITFRF